MSRFARKKDLNHRQIVEAFRAHGCSVLVTESGRAGVPDLLVGRGGENWLVEIKQPGEKLSSRQEEWASAWRGGLVVVVRCPEDVAVVVGWMCGLGAKREQS